MSTDDQRAKRFVELVVSTGEQARRAAFGDAPRRGAGATAPGAFTAANEGFAGAADAGRQIARFAVRTAIDFGRLLESMLGEEPGAEGSAPSSSGDREAGGTAELQLPSSSRGESTSASFDVRTSRPSAARRSSSTSRPLSHVELAPFARPVRGSSEPGSPMPTRPRLPASPSTRSTSPAISRRQPS